MAKIKAFLFDMDGVVTNTEVQYDIFLTKLGKEYNIPLDFVQKTKGNRLVDIIAKYFSHFTLEKQKEVADKVVNFELNEMIYDPIPGVLSFIKSAQEQQIKIALVTSSIKEKTIVALRNLGLTNTFEAVVTADDVTEGKPSPQCYSKAAEELKVSPKNCMVFEDAFSGIQAAKEAGIAKVIGVSTTNSKEALEGKTDRVIPNFEGLKVEEFLN